MSDVFSILVKPIVSEKVTTMTSNNRYAFEVSMKATKPEIKSAVEQLFKVSVLSVKTSIIRGKNKNFGRSVVKRPNKKKAFVQLAANQTIEIFQGT